MKTFKLLFLLIFISGMVVISCNDDDGNTIVPVPVIESLNIQGGENVQVQLMDSIYFDATLSDAARPLSTLEVELVANDIVLSSKSIRTKGNSVSLEDVSLFVPFAANIATGDELTVNFTLINVDGGEAKVQKVVEAIRPDLPATLYLILSDESPIELHVSGEDPYIYESEEGGYLSSFSTKIATAEDLAAAEYVWNAGVGDNVAAIGDRFGTDARFSYNSWIVSKVIFNALSFTFDKEGVELELIINDVQMASIGDYIYASVDFTKDEEFEILGIDDVEAAYNRDFFEYDPGTGKCKFIGESGTWEVYYSLKYNYFWVNRMSDVAPAAYWIVGAGHTSVPRWHADFNDMGWSTDDIKQLAYMRPLGANKYQASIYLSDQVTWGFDIQMFGDREWGGMAMFAEEGLTGDKEGILVHSGTLADIVMGGGFVPGYFRLTLDVSGGLANAKLDIERLF